MEITSLLQMPSNYIEDKIGKLERYFNDVPNAVAHVKVKRIKILQLKSK